MTDKTRQPNRNLRAPHGFLPNWAVALIAACVGTAAIILNAIT
jgi:hypothetical protein